jgi:hypothetical protein
VRRDLGWFNVLDRPDNGGFQRVGLEDPKFERDFEVYGTDQVEARNLIDPTFMERLRALESQFGSQRLRCAFKEGDLLVAVEGGDGFELELGSMFSPLANPDRIVGALYDMAEILRLIDAILTAEKAPLVARGADIPIDAS